jgi:tripartite-type tricarboxylate transporter receptor subunit TctC
MSIRRKLVFVAATLVAACLIAPAFAETWPQRGVTIVVPFAAGGNTDGIARMIGQRLTESLGQQFIVENKGNAPALADVIAGHVPAMFCNLSDTLPQAASGNIRMIAVSGDKRAAQIPDVATVVEFGYPKYKAHTWNGLVAPAGTLKEIIDKVAKLVESAIKDPTLAKKLATYGVDPLGNTPEEV